MSDPNIKMSTVPGFDPAIPPYPGPDPGTDDPPNPIPAPEPDPRASDAPRAAAQARTHDLDRASQNAPEISLSGHPELTIPGHPDCYNSMNKIGKFP